MFWKVTVAQTKDLLKKKEAILVFLLLFGLVIYDVIINVLAFQGTDVIGMYHPIKIMLFNQNRYNHGAENTLLLIQMYPLLVALPAGLALAKEYQQGENVYMSARLGRKLYQMSKVAAAFLTTVVVFTVPFLMEFVLHCVAFPLHAMGDLTGLHSYAEQYLQGVSNYFMSGLYKFNPYLYALMGILLFGIVSGLLGAMTVVISGLIRIKYNVFLLFPSVVLLNASVMMPTSLSFSCRWYDYLLLCNTQIKNNFFFIGVVGGIVLFVAVGTVLSGRKDCL